MTPDYRIPEADFAADLQAGLDELSRAIRASGLTLSEIARGTRCHWNTVYNAVKGIPVRFDSYRRIMYYLKTVSR